MPMRIMWDFVILWTLRDGEVHHLTEIYDTIDKDLKDGSINPQLFNVDFRWGDRAKYTHVVRSAMSNLKERGMVEHVGRGRTGKYRITDLGRRRLEEVEP